MDIDAGIVRISLYPFAAAMKASAIPVLPEVGSTSVVLPGEMRPAASAASTMANPILSFTLEHGSCGERTRRVARVREVNERNERNER